jgi:hypothetical protein
MAVGELHNANDAALLTHPFSKILFSALSFSLSLSFSHQCKLPPACVALSLFVCVCASLDAYCHCHPRFAHLCVARSLPCKTLHCANSTVVTTGDAVAVTSDAAAAATGTAAATCCGEVIEAVNCPGNRTNISQPETQRLYDHRIYKQSFHIHVQALTITRKGKTKQKADQVIQGLHKRTCHTVYYSITSRALVSSAPPTPVGAR